MALKATGEDPRDEESGAEVQHRDRRDGGWWIKTSVDASLLVWHTTLVVMITLQALPHR